MAEQFDAAYAKPPFSDLCANYPEDAYPRGEFRVEWGPIFHRGRLDGTARVLVIGQDPAAHEAICRRILVGVAGSRIQGFLAKLGIRSAYVMINTFLFSQVGADETRFVTHPRIAQYRRLWLEEILDRSQIVAVVTLGQAAHFAWRDYKNYGAIDASGIAYENITHPTEPYKDSRGNPAMQPELVVKMLENWNEAIQQLRPVLEASGAMDSTPDPDLYLVKERDFLPSELPLIPRRDLPAGLPAWMTSHADWAQRTAVEVGERWQVTVTVPSASRQSVSRLALSGRVVTMGAGGVIEQATIYIEDDRIVAIRKPNESVPEGFDRVAVVATEGTIYPGLIELHSHPEYHFLAPWTPDRNFQRRELWLADAEYRQLVDAPAHAAKKRFAPAVARYVDCKFLIAGVTTATAVALQDVNTGQVSRYRGAVRDLATGVQATPRLPAATVRVFEPKNQDELKQYAEDLARAHCLLLHLSEGTDLPAYEHFRYLKQGRGFASAVSAIHCVALDVPDLEALRRAGSSLVWSPFSNLVLYGATLRIDDVVSLGMNVALGADWSVTGSRSLLWELKVARVVSAALGAPLGDRELVEMATVRPARMLGWEAGVGRLEPGKLADLVVLREAAGDPYQALVLASEASIELVVAGGVPRAGRLEKMQQALPGAELEVLDVGGGFSRAFNHAGLDPVATGLPLATARAQLETLFGPSDRWPKAPGVELVLDYDAGSAAGAAAEPDLAVRMLGLDPLVTAADGDYFERIRRSISDEALGDAIAELFRESLNAS